MEPRKVGDPQQPQRHGLILLLIGEKHARLEKLLREHAYRLVVPTTADQAVAICLNNRMQAVLIDSDWLDEKEDWSLAQSLKMVSPDTPVLLIARASDEPSKVPESVDCVVSDAEPQQILDELRRCVQTPTKRRA